jgi:carbonic anhydrase
MSERALVVRWAGVPVFTNRNREEFKNGMVWLHKAVAVDVAALKANPLLPGGFLVTGLVYDVTTGRIETVVPTSLLRPEKGLDKASCDRTQ